MESQPRFLDLKSGLRIAYEEYGDPAGEPVIFCHGWPSSRIMAALAHDAARALGLRIISPDRPGISLSQFQPGRTLLDWPSLVTELTQSLNIARYYVFGISGGGPYALATAWKNPDAVKAAAVASGAVPLAERTTNEGLFFAYAWLLGIHRRNSAMLRLLLRMFRPLILMPLPDAFKTAVIALQQRADRKALGGDRKAFDICFESSREAWRKDAAGATHDGLLYAEPWGFSPGEIRVPVRFWHGKDDRQFSWKLVEKLAPGIPRNASHFLENEGHYSLPIMHMHEILEDLRSAGSPDNRQTQ
jgi:pimeloyl-ACP methyl ester carboxylesterase